VGEEEGEENDASFIQPKLLGEEDYPYAEDFEDAPEVVFRKMLKCLQFLRVWHHYGCCYYECVDVCDGLR
jgi:hypothetical protein